MAITERQLLQILPNAGTKAGVFVPALNAAMGKYAIVTRLRVAAFIAQIGHESGQLRYVRELGSNDYLSKYDTGKLAKALGNTPEADGDGKSTGQGLIQVTAGRTTKPAARALFGDSRLLNTPELLEHPVYACLSAGWYWHRAELNNLADKGAFVLITKRINGGINGLADREVLYERALEVLQ